MAALCPSHSVTVGAVALRSVSLASHTSRTQVALSTGNGAARPVRCRMVVVRAAADGDAQTTAVAPPQLAKGNVVRVDKDKYLASLEFKAVDHPPYFKGLDYLYEARGEVLDLRSFPAGNYALVAWTGIPTAPAWLPVTMLIKAPKLEYRRI